MWRCELEKEFPEVKFTKSIVFFNKMTEVQVGQLQKRIGECKAIVRLSAWLKEGELLTGEIYIKSK